MPYIYDLDRGVEQLVARWAHNPKVRGSNPLPATNIKGSDSFMIPFLFLGNRSCFLFILFDAGYIVSTENFEKREAQLYDILNFSKLN